MLTMLIKLFVAKESSKDVTLLISTTDIHDCDKGPGISECVSKPSTAVHWPLFFYDKQFC